MSFSSDTVMSFRISSVPWPPNDASLLSVSLPASAGIVHLGEWSISGNDGSKLYSLARSDGVGGRPAWGVLNIMGTSSSVDG